MSDKQKSCLVKGKGGDSVRHDPNFIGWLGQVAHPDSPAGSGGPGGFTQSHPVATDDTTGATGDAPGPLQFVPMDADPPTPANPPPATNPRSLGSKAQADNDLMDVSIDAEVLADGTSTGGVETSVSKPASTSPQYETDGAGNITAFTGKFVWKGTIGIQTVYGSGSGASDVSCYGRGTTDDDVGNRDITLGFHEHQHQQDYVNYLTNNALPDVPALRIPMTVNEYNTETTRFSTQLDAYFDAMEANTVANTDEVGHHKSTWEETSNCYVHLLPPD